MNVLYKLVPYYSIPLEELQENRELRSLLEQVENMPIDVFQKAKSRLVKPTWMEPGTLASYLFGADLNHYGDVNKNCSLFYLEAKREREGEEDEGEDQCQAQIWSRKNEKLDQKVKYPSTHALLYLLDEPFEGLKQKELEELSSKGVETISLVETVKGKHKVIYEKESLLTVPTELDVQEGFVARTYFHPKDEENNFLPILLIVGFILIVLYFLLK